jgi:cytochrome c biogenesis protein CcdA
MDHLDFILAAYGFGIAVPLVLAIAASRRLQRAARRLAALDPQNSRRQRSSDARQQELGAL